MSGKKHFLLSKFKASVRLEPSSRGTGLRSILTLFDEVSLIWKQEGFLIVGLFAGQFGSFSAKSLERPLVLKTYKCTQSCGAEFCLWCAIVLCVQDEQMTDRKWTLRDVAGWGESHSAAHSHNSGKSNLIWLEVNISRMPHGSPPKLTSWIFYRASLSTLILIPKWCTGQLYDGTAYTMYM